MEKVQFRDCWRRFGHPLASQTPYSVIDCYCSPQALESYAGSDTNMALDPQLNFAVFQSLSRQTQSLDLMIKVQQNRSMLLMKTPIGINTRRAAGFMGKSSAVTMGDEGQKTDRQSRRERKDFKRPSLDQRRTILLLHPTMPRMPILLSVEDGSVNALDLPTRCQ